MRLKVAAHRDVAKDELEGVLVQRLNDLVLLACVRHKVIENYAAFNEGFHIELFLELGLHQTIALSRFETLIKTTAGILEWQRLELILQLNLEPLLLSFFVQRLIIKEHQHEHFGSRARRLERIPVQPILAALLELVLLRFLLEFQALQLLQKHVLAAVRG